MAKLKIKKDEKVIVLKRATFQFTKKDDEIKHTYVRIPLDHGRAIYRDMQQLIESGFKPVMYVIYDPEKKVLCFFLDEKDAERHYSEIVGRKQKIDDRTVKALIEFLTEEIEKKQKSK